MLGRWLTNRTALGGQRLGIQQPAVRLQHSRRGGLFQTERGDSEEKNLGSTREDPKHSPRSHFSWAFEKLEIFFFRLHWSFVCVGIIFLKLFLYCLFQTRCSDEKSVCQPGSCSMLCPLFLSREDWRISLYPWGSETSQAMALFSFESKYLCVFNVKMCFL